MASKVRIALDAMGGDHGPSVAIPGAALSLQRHPDLAFELHGDEAVIRPLLVRHEALAPAATVHHTDIAIKMDDKPSQALRYGRWKSSMWRAIEAVKKAPTLWSKNGRRAAIRVTAVPTPPAPTSSTRMAELFLPWRVPACRKETPGGCARSMVLA